MSSAHWAHAEIRRLRRLDAERVAGAFREVAFVGSSVFREWREMRDFERDWRALMRRRDVRVMNRAFGGSETRDLLTYADDLTRRETRAVVYYCGSNDVSNGARAREVRDNFVAFVESRRRLGVVYVSVIDSPQKRAWGLSDVVRDVNALCEQWCAENGPSCAYVDLSRVFEDPVTGALAPLFREDGTHLVPSAYDGVIEAIEPKLDDVLREVLESGGDGEGDGEDDDAFLPPSMRR
ncbi:SGNH hydrolase-type esterase domain-containing protein [Ostreococcus tauri]|uniref:SGNH hydrolase-type esterase domain-containing protein n=1 Tax=Ostreococcus tauri TaxID=70448 RepID=A0A1Y5HX50_OSTTA|nr:SGNH hydrolase-type esterase domain-containing protein [Ostreococcus tauri]